MVAIAMDRTQMATRIRAATALTTTTSTPTALSSSSRFRTGRARRNFRLEATDFQMTGVDPDRARLLRASFAARRTDCLPPFLRLEIISQNPYQEGVLSVA